MSRLMARSGEPPRRHCIHYDPRSMLMGDATTCRAGVDFKALGANFKERPCIDGHRFEVCPCPKWERPTLESALAEEKAMDEHMERVLKVLPAVSEWRNKKKPFFKEGSIPCPACAGTLHLNQSGLNGHVWGKCETLGCAEWIE